MLFDNNATDICAKMSKQLKSNLISVFSFLPKEDRSYILDHIELFIDSSDMVMIPKQTTYALDAIRALDTTLKMKKYYVEYYSMEVTDPAPIIQSKNVIIVGRELGQISNIFREIITYYDWIPTITPVNKVMPVLEHATLGSSKDMYELIRFFSEFIDSVDLYVGYYPEILRIIARPYDIISRIRMLKFGDFQDAQILTSQILAFKYTFEALREGTQLIRGNEHAREQIDTMLLLEINILTSLVPITTVEEDWKIIKTPRLLKSVGSAISNDYILTNIRHFKERSNHDPFTIPLVDNIRYVDITKKPPTSSIPKNNDIHTDFLISTITKEKIINAIEDRTGAIMSLNDITFDIPGNMLTMYQLEFGKTYPIRMVSGDDNEWRHVIQYSSIPLLAFYFRSDESKLFGINIRESGDELVKCTIVEFVGKSGMSYEYLY